MLTRVIKTPLQGLLILEIDYFKDERGYFIESWHKKDFANAGLNLDFVQEGQSGSKRNVLRGLHYQNMKAPMAKLVRCLVGKIFDVVLDLRYGSKTLGNWFGLELSTMDKRQLFVPVGFAHGFVTLSDWAEVCYKQTGFYNPKAEGSIIWNDPDIAITWPVSEPIISKKDSMAMTFRDYLKKPAFQ